MEPTAPDVAGAAPHFHHFTPDAWSMRRGDQTLSLSASEIVALRSRGDRIDLAEAERIYLPLARLLSDHVKAAQALFKERKSFLGLDGQKTPFILAIAGSVAVGKSTTARLLQQLMRRWPSSPRVDLVTTDGFLYPNAVLEERGLMRRKGFPESYDRAAMVEFLGAVKAGADRVIAPVYSHLSYDIERGRAVAVEAPDILIFEGLNVLQPPPSADLIGQMASDFFDFSIYVDAAEADIRDWYLSRFMRLRETAFTDPNSFFHRYVSINEGEAREIAEDLWDGINAVNLAENIRPTRPRADVILRKGTDHRMDRISVRKL